MGSKEKTEGSADERRIAAKEHFQEAMEEKDLEGIYQAISEHYKVDRSLYSQTTGDMIAKGMQLIGEVIDGLSVEELTLFCSGMEVANKLLKYSISQAGAYTPGFYEAKDFYIGIIRSLIEKPVDFLYTEPSIISIIKKNIGEIKEWQNSKKVKDLSADIVINSLWQFLSLFKEKCREDFHRQVEEADGEKSLPVLSKVAKGYLLFNKQEDRDEAWKVISLGVNVAQKLETCTSFDQTIIALTQLVDFSCLFGYSPNGDFTLLNDTTQALFRVLKITPQGWNRLQKQTQDLVLSVLKIRLAELRKSKKPKRMIEIISRSFNELSEGMVIENKNTNGNETRRMPTTLLRRLTGKLGTRRLTVTEKEKEIKTFPVGSVLRTMDGDFEILEILIGGESVVYKVKNEFGKVMTARTSKYLEESTREKLLEKARKLNEIRSGLPNGLKTSVVEVYDIKRGKDGRFYVLQEWVEGKSLQAIFEQSGRFTEEVVDSIIGRLAEVLVIHRQNVHRDLKPENIMVETGGRIVIIDWDLLVPKNCLNDKKGTPQYAAPEQLQSGAPVTEKVDIYALGIIAYQLLTGEEPNGPNYFGTVFQRFPNLDKQSAKWQKIIEGCTRVVVSERWTGEMILEELKKDSLINRDFRRISLGLVLSQKPIGYK